MRERLFLLSHCALRADGTLDPFVRQELPGLQARFGVSLVCPRGVFLRAADAPGEKPLRAPLAWLRAAFRAAFLPELHRELRRMRADGALTPRTGAQLFCFAARGLAMHLHLERALAAAPDAPATLYAAWMSTDALAAALTRQKHLRLRFVARAHAFDIDPARDPITRYRMKRLIAAQADALCPISETAKALLLSALPAGARTDHVRVLPMGSAGRPVARIHGAPRFSLGVLHIVSCADVVPVKQVEQIVRALALWDGMPVHWTHLGGGAGLAALQALAQTLLGGRARIACEFAGHLAPEAVEAIYEARAFDVFVNCSASEGSPVSVMEAMRCGIPAIAPRVGGLPELLPPQVGLLYDPARGAQGLCDALASFCALGPEEDAVMRRAAKARWDACCCGEALLPRLFFCGEEEAR